MDPLTKTFCVLALFAFSCPTTLSQAPIDPDTSPPTRWWKGNLHTHSLWSDGDDFPEMIAAWYQEHDYSFLALSDHNVLSEGTRWMPLKSILQRGGPEVLKKYERRFGHAWVETRLSEETNNLEVRLKPLDEFRGLVERGGKFLMIPAEEISDKAEGKPVHMNATNLLELIKPLGGATVRTEFIASLKPSKSTLANPTVGDEPFAKPLDPDVNCTFGLL